MDSPVLNFLALFLIGCLFYPFYESIFDNSQVEEEIKVISDYYDSEDLIRVKNLGDNKYLVFITEKGSNVYKEEIVSFTNKKSKPVIENVYKKE